MILSKTRLIILAIILAIILIIISEFSVYVEFIILLSLLL